MAFTRIFPTQVEYEIRSESMTVPAFRAGDKVKYRHMSMPGEILSGPHKSPGVDRWLIRKADGNVSLVPARELERIPSREEQMANQLSVILFGTQFGALDARMRLSVTRAATRALALADDTREQA
jgi:hypothetical protein